MSTWRLLVTTSRQFHLATSSCHRLSRQPHSGHSGQHMGRCEISDNHAGALRCSPETANHRAQFHPVGSFPVGLTEINSPIMIPNSPTLSVQLPICLQSPTSSLGDARWYGCNILFFFPFLELRDYRQTIQGSETIRSTRDSTSIFPTWSSCSRV